MNELTSKSMGLWVFDCTSHWFFSEWVNALSSIYTVKKPTGNYFNTIATYKIVNNKQRMCKKKTFVTKEDIIPINGLASMFITIKKQ